MNNYKEMISLLKEAAENHQPQLEKKLRARLNGREKGILDWLLLQYQDQNKRRWYDPYHILFSTNFALDLIEVEKLDRLIVAGIMLHDIGYFAIEDKTQWNSRESRIIHMQEGSALAARVLYENDFMANELEKVLGMIGVHDNPYLGIAIQGRDRLGLRDCDRVWVMHLLSYYKDLFSKPERSEHPQEFLHDRMTQFYGWENPFGTEWMSTVDRIKKNAHRIEIPTYSFTKDRINAQFESRVQEQQYANLLSNTNEFGQHLLTQIPKE